MATKPEKLKSGNYRVRTSYLDETGKQKFKSFTSRTAKEATFLALQFEVDHKHALKPENISLKQAIEKFIGNRENILSPSTIVGYEQLKRNAYGSIINMRLGILKKEDIQKAINDYSKDHSPKSVRNALGLLKAVLREFYSELNTEGIILPPKRTPTMVIPTTEQVQEVIQAAQGTDLYLPILLGALLGLRRSEVFALTWDDVDLDNKTLTIDKATVRNKNRDWVVKETKTTSSKRVLPLPAIILDELTDDAKPLITITASQFSDRYSKLCKPLGVPQGFHTLRHYNASIMLLQNVPNKYAQERLGHATDNMLKQVYQHTFKKEQDIIADRLNEFFNENIKKEG